MPEIKPVVETFARIRVIGVGGAGGAAVNRMIGANVKGIDFVAVNTDAQALHHSEANTKVHIGKETTRGLGAGADPEVGKKAAEESRDELKKLLEGSDMVFVTFGAGGGTGSGAGPVVAEIAKELDILVVGIATKPFAFEGERRRRNAEVAIQNLRKSVDTLITIPNDKLLQTIDRRTPLMEAFTVVDDVLRQGVQGISDLITTHGLINLDFADVKAVMQNAGSALMGIGHASGENRALEAAQQAIASPLLEVSIDGARGVLFNVTGGPDMSMHEINEAAEAITAAVDSEANIIFGATLDPEMSDQIKITVIATGFDAAYFAETNRQGNNGLAYFNKPDHGDDSINDINNSDIANVDMSLDSGANSAQNDDDMQSPIASSNVWAIDDDDDYDVPAFVRRQQNDDDDDDDDDDKKKED